MTAISPIPPKGLKALLNWRAEVPATSLTVYRMLFGALLFFSTARFLMKGWVYDFYIAPQFHFSYYGFEWLPYPSSFAIYFIFGLMLVSSLGILSGFFYRFSCITFFVLFTYVELLDKTTYLNHYYFVSLIVFLMIFLPANRYFSLDVYFGHMPMERTTANRNIAILKIQVALVYVFAGIAKLGPDWLIEAQPLRYWLHTAHHWPFIGDLLKEDWVAYFFSWFGCVYDLFIIFFLLAARTRVVAYFVVVVFHVTTWLLFPIGVFPWVMIAATTIFLPENFHRAVLDAFRRVLPAGRNLSATFVVRPFLQARSVTLIFVCFVTFQLLFPFRYLLYPGDIFWTEQGYRFSWRVMLMEKTGYAEFYIVDPEKQAWWSIDNSNYLTRQQEKMMSTQPDMILEYAHFLRDEYADTTLVLGEKQLDFKNPGVHAEIYVTLNGRPSQLYVDKSHNLAAIENDLSHRYWLEEFKE